MYKRQIQRECKYYFVDWKESKEAVFENYVAATLYRSVTLWHDRYGENFELNFIRTHDGTEVDFLITKDNKPWMLIEAKEGKPEISSACYRFSHELNVPCVVVTKQNDYARKTLGDKKQKIYQISMNRFATRLA